MHGGRLFCRERSCRQSIRSDRIDLLAFFSAAGGPAALAGVCMIYKGDPGLLIGDRTGNNYIRPFTIQGTPSQHGPPHQSVPVITSPTCRETVITYCCCSRGPTRSNSPEIPPNGQPLNAILPRSRVTVLRQIDMMSAIRCCVGYITYIFSPPGGHGHDIRRYIYTKQPFA